MIGMFQQFQFYIGMALGLSLLAWQFWPALSKLGPTMLRLGTWATSPVGSSTISGPMIGQLVVEVDPHTQAFQAVKLLHDRFSENHCAEGVKAAETALSLLLRKGAE